MNKQKLRVIGWVVIALTAYFFTRALIRNWDNLQDIDFSFNAYSVASIVLFVLAVIYSGKLWADILRDLTKTKVSTSEMIRVQISSWLLKYVPGQAGSIINKINWGTKQGISKKVVTISFIYENVFLALASVALSLPVISILFFDDVSGNLNSFLPLLLVAAMLPFLSKRFFYKSFNLLFKKLRNQSIDEEYFFGTKKLVEYFFRFMGPRIVTAAAFLCVAASFMDIPADTWIGLGAIYILAGIIGILAIFVPSGLGVREAVIVLLASNYFPVESAIALALLARLYNTVADGILALIYAGMTRRKVAK